MVFSCTISLMEVFMSGVYCKKHDEIEPYNWDYQTDGLYLCPQCSKESLKKLNIRDENGKTRLDRALEEIEKQFGRK